MAKKIKGFRVDVIGAQQVAKRLSKPLTRMMNKNMALAAKLQLRAIQAEVPVRTGKLKRSLKSRQSGKYHYSISAGPTAVFSLRGVRRHPIFPNRKMALAWPGMIGGPFRSVNHPGQKRNPWFPRGVKRAKPKINRLLRQFGNAIVREYS